MEQNNDLDAGFARAGTDVDRTLNVRNSLSDHGRQPVCKYPTDVTAATVRNLGKSVKVKRLKVAGGSAETLASGRIRVINPTEDIAIMMGRLAGQRAYDALIAGELGLSVEIRLNGISHAREVLGTGRESLLKPGDLQITGSSFRTQWAVTAKPQHLFEAVAVRYSARYLESVSERVPELVSWALSTISMNRQVVLSAPADLTGLAERMLATSVDDADNSLLMEAYAMQILVAVWHRAIGRGTSSASTTEENEIVSHALQVIRANPTASLTIAEIAKACRVSASRLKTLFQKSHPTSIGAEIINVRMSMAAQMIGDGVTISKAAETLGYRSPEAFSRAVRQHFGRPPRDLQPP